MNVRARGIAAPGVCEVPQAASASASAIIATAAACRREGLTRSLLLRGASVARL